MPLGSQNKQTSYGTHLLRFGAGYLAVRGKTLGKVFPGLSDDLVCSFGITRRLCNYRVVVAFFLQVVLSKVFGIAAKHDVGAAARHVRCDGNRAEFTGLCNDFGFFFMVLGIQDRVRDAALFQQRRQILTLLNGYRTDQNRLSLFMTLGDLINDGMVLSDVAAVYDVRPILPDYRFVGRDFNDIQFVNGGKFLRFRHSGTGHAGELLVQAEIVLEGNGRQRFVFLLDVHMLFGFNGLMKTFGVSAAEHQAAGELVHDDDFTVFDDIVDIPLHDAVRPHRLVDVVAQRSVLHIRQVFQSECALRLRDAACRQGCGPCLLVHNVVGIQVFALFFLFIDRCINDLFQSANEIVRLTVQIGAFVALP